jgi:hypothetical protein
MLGALLVEFRIATGRPFYWLVESQRMVLMASPSGDGTCGANSRRYTKNHEN